MAWRALFKGLPDVTGTVVAEPAPAGCATAEVLVARRSGRPLRLPQKEERLFVPDRLTTPLTMQALWAAAGDPACTLMLVFRRIKDGDEIAVSASWNARASMPVDSIVGPRPDAWLAALLPAAAVADTVGVCLLVPMIFCLSHKQWCGDLIGSSIPGYERTGSSATTHPASSARQRP